MNLGAGQIAWLMASAVCVTACSGGGNGANAPDTQPVKNQPLQGTIEGVTFDATNALAKPGFALVGIFDDNATCANQFTTTHSPMILVNVTDWTAGTAYELGGDGGLSVTFVTQTPGSSDPQNDVVFTGRVEVDTSPVAGLDGGAGTPGVLGVRASDPMLGSVEGRVSVVFCP